MRRHPGRDHDRRGIDRVAGRLAAGVRRRPRLRLQVEHGLDARHARVHAAGAGAPALAPRRDDLRAPLRVHREFRAAALARRGRARQGLAARARCRATTGRSSPRCAPTTPSCGGIRARSCCSWARNSRRAASGIRRRARLASCSTSAGIAACRRSSATATAPTAAQPALHERDCEAEGFRWIDVDDAETVGLRLAAHRRRRRARRSRSSSNFTPVPRDGYRIGLPLPGRWREILNTDAAVYGGSDRGNAGGVVARRRREPRLSASRRAVMLPPLATLWLVHDGGA